MLRAQASTLRVFMSILNDAAFLKAEPAAARELLIFIRRTLRGMFDRMMPPAPDGEAVPSDVPCGPHAPQPYSIRMIQPTRCGARVNSVGTQASPGVLQA